MPRIKVALVAGVASVALVAMAGCSKSSDSSASQTPPDASANTSAQATDQNSAASNTAAADSNSAPAPAASAAAAPAAGMIPLDIKDATGAAVSGDPVDGKEVFQQCAVCHSTEAGVNKVGPSLHGIIGRHSGIAPNFNYSQANKGSGIVWTEQNIYKYLNNPQAMVPGTYMTFTGVQDPQKRADVIAYLQENTK
jgi:cytochrome c